MSAPELLLAAGAGAACGAGAGLVPGLHPNTLAVLALGALPSLPPEAAMPAAAALVAMGIAHQFTAILPAGFLGAPSADDALRALPAHALLQEGRAHEAVQLAARGTALGVLGGVALVVPMHLLLGGDGAGYRWLEPALPLVLAAIAAVLLLTETARVPWRRAVRASPFPEPGDAEARGRLLRREGATLLVRTPRGKAWVDDPLGLLAEAAEADEVVARGPRARVAGPGSAALGVAAAALVFALAGALGVAAGRLATPSPLGLPASPMFPLLTGLFGAPPLLLALRARPAPRQREAPAPEAPPGAPAAAGAACGALVGLLPGMSSSAASVLALAAAPARGREGALAALSAAGGSAAVVTVAAFVLVQRARSGAMLAVAEFAPPEPWLGLAPPPLLAVLLLGVAAGALLGYPAALVAGRAAARVVHRVPYAALSAGVLALLVALVAAFTGALGLAVLAVAACVGLLPWRWGLRKGHLMGCTMLPLILPG